MLLISDFFELDGHFRRNGDGERNGFSCHMTSFSGEAGLVKTWKRANAAKKLRRLRGRYRNIANHGSSVAEAWRQPRHDLTSVPLIICPEAPCGLR